MACERLGGRKYLLRSRPPYSAYGCAWKTRMGNDGKEYTSVPNDNGQYVWVALPPKVPLSRKVAFLSKAGYVLAAKLVMNKLGNSDMLNKTFPGGVSWSDHHYSHNPGNIDKSDKSIGWFLRKGATKVYKNHLAR